MPALLKLTDLTAKLRRSRSTIYKDIEEGLFPKPIKIGHGAFWRDDELASMIDAYSGGADSSRLRELAVAIEDHRASLS